METAGYLKARGDRDHQESGDEESPHYRQCRDHSYGGEENDQIVQCLYRQPGDARKLFIERDCKELL